MKKIILAGHYIFTLSAGCSPPGNCEPSGSEVVNFGSIDLVGPGSQTWATETPNRRKCPAYVNAIIFHGRRVLKFKYF